MSKYISVTETAKLVRAALKRAFPQVKFSVTSDKYTGSSSIDVRWTDGPTVKTVNEHVKRFEGSTFDGMQDLKEYHDSTLNGESVHFAADHVMTSRQFSAAFLTDIARKICEKWGEPMPRIKTYGADQDNAYVDDDGVYKRIGGSDRCLSQLIDQEANKTAAAGVSIPTSKPAVQRGVITATWHDNQWVIAGDTYPHRAIIKDAGGRWDKASQAWIISFDPDGVYYTMELPASIRAIVTTPAAAPEIAESEQAVDQEYVESMAIIAARNDQNIQAGDQIEVISFYKDIPVGKRATVEKVWATPGGTNWAQLYLGTNLGGQKLKVSMPFSQIKRIDAESAITFEDGSHLEYPRDSIIYEPLPIPELYVYTMLNRPAGYGTCPDGRVVDLDKSNMPSFEIEHYGTVTYTRKLTPQEMYKWEMVPQSENAYTYPIGARVLVNEQDEATVIAHLPRHWYGVRYDCNGRSVDRNVKDLAPLPEPEPPAPQPDPAIPDLPTGEQLSAMSGADRVALMHSLPKDKQAIVAARYAEANPLKLNPITGNAGTDLNKPALYPLPEVTPEPIAIPAPVLSDTTDWPAFDLDYLPGVLDYGRAVDDSGYHGSKLTGHIEAGRPMSTGVSEYAIPKTAQCSLCGRAIPAGQITCSFCEGRQAAYEDRRNARIARLENRADKAHHESAALWDKSHKMASVIPFGQPILVGHHSEGRDRRYRDRIHNTGQKAYEAGKKAKYYEQRAAAAASNRQISSDDPAALLKLREKLAILEARQEEMKRINKLVKKVLTGVNKTAQVRALDARKNRVVSASLYRDQTSEERREAWDKQQAEERAVKELYIAQAPQLATLAGISESRAIGFLTPDDLGRIGYPSYELTNNNAEVRRITKRIAELEQRAKVVETLSAEVDPQPVLYPHDATVIENALENRLQIAFPGKPQPEIIQALKRHGFHWSRSQGVWQRMISTQARYAVVDVLGKPLAIPEQTPIADETLVLEDGSHLEYERDSVVYEPVYTEPEPRVIKQLTLL